MYALRLSWFNEAFLNSCVGTEFLSRFNNLKDIDGSLFLDVGQGPMEEYENLRRRIYSNTKELWYFINHELSKVGTDNLKSDKIQTILDQAGDRKRFVFAWQ